MYKDINRLKRILLVGYLVIILFFMFFGFGRISRFDSFQFSLTMNHFPLWIPKQLDTLKIWIFAMGNLVAFIPFGVLIPLNLKISSRVFLKSTLIFIVSITILEILQMLSLLGSFDIADIVVNTIGFLIGYASWKIGKSGNTFSGQIVRFSVACIIFVIFTVVSGELFNSFLR